jgi:hypothetical protein
VGILALVAVGWLWSLLVERLEESEILSRAVRRRYALTRDDVRRMIEREKSRED